jgi:MerR family mercuric resistance operon transcriptional regulator
MDGFTIGEVAARAGVNIQTLRYYERRGLLPRPDRTTSNYRRYSPDAVQRVRFVKRAQALGFSLSEVAELLALRVQRNGRCAGVRRRAEAKLADVEQKLRALRAMRTALVQLVKECRGEAPISACPILEAIDANGIP